MMQESQAWKSMLSTWQLVIAAMPDRPELEQPFAFMHQSNHQGQVWTRDLIRMIALRSLRSLSARWPVRTTALLTAYGPTPNARPISPWVSPHSSHASAIATRRPQPPPRRFNNVARSTRTSRHTCVSTTDSAGRMRSSRRPVSSPPTGRALSRRFMRSTHGRSPSNNCPSTAAHGLTPPFSLPSRRKAA